MNLRVAITVALALATPSFAQTVRVVDRLGGGQFTDLATAIAASAPGDTILIRNGGTFPGGTVSIPLRIVAEPPRPRIQNLRFAFASRPTQPVVVAGVLIDFGSIRGANEASFDDVSCFILEVWDTTALLLDRVASITPVRIEATSAAVVDCTFQGARGACYDSHGNWYIANPEPGMVVNSSLLFVAGGTITGGAGEASTNCGNIPPAAAITGTGSSVHLTHCTVASGAGTPQVAVDLVSSTVAADPTVSFVGSSTPPASSAELPALRGTGAAAGQGASLRLSTTADALAFVAVAACVMAPVTYPFGSLWIDGSSYVVTVFSGIADPTGEATWNYLMPPLAPGNALHFQGAVVLSGGTALLTAPLSVVSR